MPPADAKRVAGGVGVDLVAFGNVGIGRRQKKAGAEPHRLIVGAPGIIDMKIEMNLLLLDSIGPLRRDMIGRQLHTEAPRSRLVEDAVPIVVFDHVAADDPGPKRALRLQVGRVKHDDVSNHFHVPNFTWEPSGN